MTEDRISKIIFDWVKEIAIATGFSVVLFEYLNGKMFGNLNPDVTLWFVIVAPVAWVSIATYIAASALARRYALVKDWARLTSVVSCRFVGWVIFASFFICLLLIFLIFTGAVLGPLDKSSAHSWCDHVLTIFVRSR